MKAVLNSLLIGLFTAVVGWIFVSLLSQTLFSGVSLEASSICGWGAYLCIVIVVCTRYIVAKLNDILPWGKQLNPHEDEEA